MSPSGRLFVVSGPSGAGKGTLVGKLMARVPDIYLSVSATTRAPRRGEIAGRDYIFVTPEEFEAHDERGEFLEWAEVHGHKYGTLRTEIERQLANGHDVLLEIDVQGALQVREKIPKVVLIFVVAPEMADLQKRLQARKTENERESEKRFKRAEEEMRQIRQYDYVVVNDEVEGAVDELENIVVKERD